MGSPILSLASGVYQAGLTFDRWVRSRNAYRLPKPVISVGNITVGGTGKTPLIIQLASDLLAKNCHPAILTRGYRGGLRSSSKPQILRGEESDGNKTNDEAVLMAQRLPSVPIGVGAKRGKIGLSILEQTPVDIFLLDDGFQHWALRRDWDIVCIDTTNPWGGGYLLPQGRLREGFSSLSRANVVVLTRCELTSQEHVQDIQNEIQHWSPKAVVLKTTFQNSLLDFHGEKKSVSFKDKKVLALSSIGNPSSFELSVVNLGAAIHPVRYRDHHTYTEKDLDRIEKIMDKEKLPLVTTEKDWVKLKKTRWVESLPSNEVYVLKIDVVFLDSDQKKWLQTLEPFIKR